jgi:epoxyqueuosine reductase
MIIDNVFILMILLIISLIKLPFLFYNNDLCRAVIVKCRQAITLRKMTADRSTYSIMIREKARELGFFSCGISVAGKLEPESRALERWLKAGMHGKMSYMENHFEKRTDPRKLVDGAKSVISVLHNYYPANAQSDPGAPVLSKYAYGTDYHFVLKEKLRELHEFIKNNIGEVHGRAFVDSAPVLDRVWAARAGLGWIGKNTNLLVKKAGSFFFIGELIVDIELAPDDPVKDYCGTCTRCIDSCPTGAIVAPRVLDARKCLSYLTIEFRGELPEAMVGKMENRMYGCDICQDVCPWNKKAVPNGEPLFTPLAGLLEMSRDDWRGLERKTFRHYFRRSAVNRVTYQQFRRNIDFLERE